MKIEPLPIFDCMYCVKNSKLIFQKISEKYLSLKYSSPSPTDQFDSFQRIGLLDEPVGDHKVPADSYIQD
jgi:hypothetical protein